MELGNLVFGNSRGEFEIDRDWQDRFHVFLEDCGFDSYGHKAGNLSFEWENDVFWVMPYYWGDCRCGYEHREYEWSQNNHHSYKCYQSDYLRVTQDLKAQGYKRYGKDDFRFRRAYMKLCEKHGIAWDGGAGCAVHCTCDHREKWCKWLAENDHAENCLIILPNFWHKPSGLKIKWYKYPLRDSYMNKDIDYSEFKRILEECKKSINA